MSSLLRVWFAFVALRVATISRQDRLRLLLGIVEAIGACGAELAHPTRTLELSERAVRAFAGRETESAPPESGRRAQRELAEHSS